MIILGVDPGLATTGWGVVEKEKAQRRKDGGTVCLDYGVISTDPFLVPAERLKRINNELNKIIKKYQPQVLAVENVYFFKNLKTAMPVSQAKGVVLLTAAKKKIPVYEFSPLEVKMAIAGYGRAEKKQMQGMVKEYLCLQDVPRPDDAADALALAVCCGLKLRRG